MRKDGSIELTQSRMIKRVLGIAGLDPNSDRVKVHEFPASSDKLLDKNIDILPRHKSFYYRSAVGCLFYIQAMIRPDITMVVQ